MRLLKKHATTLNRKITVIAQTLIDLVCPGFFGIITRKSPQADNALPLKVVGRPILLDKAIPLDSIWKAYPLG